MNNTIWPLMGIILLTIAVAFGSSVDEIKNPKKKANYDIAKSMDNFDDKCVVLLRRGGSADVIYKCSTGEETCYYSEKGGLSCLDKK